MIREVLREFFGLLALGDFAAEQFIGQIEIARAFLDFDFELVVEPA